MRLIGALWLRGVWHCWSFLVQKSGEETDDSPKHHNAEQHSYQHPEYKERAEAAYHIVHHRCNPSFLNFATVLLLAIVLLIIVSDLPYNTLDIGGKLHTSVREWGRKRLPNASGEQHGSTTDQRRR